MFDQKIDSHVPYCCTCTYWTGNIELNSILQQISVETGSDGICNKMFLGNKTGAFSGCPAWEPRLK